MQCSKKMNKMNENKKTYTLEDFREIIRILRGEYGCPWDKEQTHGSLADCMTEEAAEAVLGIRHYEETGDAENMKEELGDVLLQIVMHAQLAEEEGLFTMEDILYEICEKMIRRHPHVFEPDGTPLNGREPDPANLKSWQEIKALEKQKNA